MFDPDFPYTVGKNGEKPVCKFKTELDASKFIAEVFGAEDPEGFRRGDYYLDGPPDDVEECEPECSCRGGV